MGRLTRNSFRPSQEINYSQTDIDEYVNNCVTYMVNNCDRLEFRKSELQKTVLMNSGRLFDEIINRTKIILKDVYGLNLLIADTGSNKTYFLSSALPYHDDQQKTNDSSSEDKEKILKLLILTHIFMSGGTVTDGALHSFLKDLDIAVDTQDPIFDNVNNFINQKLIQQKYLFSESDPITNQITYKWGIRAEIEVNKMDILKFVCEVYGENQPEAWDEQYEVATKQNFQNHKID